MAWFKRLNPPRTKFKLKRKGAIKYKTAATFSIFQNRFRYKLKKTKKNNKVVTMRRRDIDSDAFSPLDRSGILPSRPELISIFDFQDLVQKPGRQNSAMGNLGSISNSSSTPTSPAGQMIDLQIAARNLRNDNLEELIKSLSKDPESTSGKTIEALKAKFSNNLKLAQEEIDFLLSIFSAQKDLTRALDIKNNQEELQKEFEIVRKDRLENIPEILKTDSIVETISFSDIMNQHYFYDPEKIKNITNSKLLLHMMHSLHNSIIFDWTTRAAANIFDDSDPFIIKKWGKPSRLSSSALVLPSSVVRANLNDKLSSDFSRWTAKIIKYLSKEFQVSGAYSDKEISESLKSIGSTSPGSGDNIDNLTGLINGDDIFGNISGPKSISSIYKSGTNKLYFDIKSFGNKKYSNGKDLIVNSIVTKKSKINTKKLEDFSTNVDEVITKNTNLLDLLTGSNNEKLQPITILNKVLESTFKLMESLNPSDSMTSFDEGMALQLSILKFARGDTSFMAWLTQYMTLWGIQGQDSGIIQSNFYKWMNESEGREIIDYVAGFKDANNIRQRLSNEGEILKAKDLVYKHAYGKHISQYIKNKYAKSNGTQNAGDRFEYAGDVFIKHTIGDMAQDLSIITTSQNSFLIENMKILNYLFDSSNELGENDIHKSGKLRFQNSSSTNISLMTTGLLAEMIYAFSGVRFYSTKNTENVDHRQTPVYSRISMEKSTLFKEELEIYLNEGLEGLSESTTQFKNFLVDTIGYFDQDYTMKIDTLDQLKSINNVLQRNSNQLLSILDPNGINKDRIEKIQNQPNSNNKLSSINIPQINISTDILEKFKKSNQDGSLTFPTDDIVKQDTKTLLYKMMEDESFNSAKSNNMKIISVGIPAGMSEEILGADEEPSSPEEKKEKDVISINVYRKDLLNDGIVFKPIAFKFELSRFFSHIKSFEKSENGLVKENFGQLVDNFVVTRDIDVTREQIIKEEVGSEFMSSDVYSRISDTDKADIRLNHIKDYMARIYVKLLTGVDLAESTFILEGEKEPLIESLDVDIITSLIDGYLRTKDESLSLDKIQKENPEMKEIINRIKGNKSSTKLLDKVETKINKDNENQNIEITEDLISFMKLVNPKSILLGSSTLLRKVTSPKKFERVFNIFVDPDWFAIDYEKSDKDEYNRLRSQNKIKWVSGQNKYLSGRKLNVDQLSLNKFFVTIERSGD